MRLLLICLVLAAMSTGPARADGERAGEFDYYVLSLSWSPNWCASNERARDTPQCAPDNGFGWILHGLWPQYARGWPDFCRTPHAPPSRAMTHGMADIMGSAGLAWHQWKKHGTCSGLSAADYFALSRRAFGWVARPDVFRQLDRFVRMPASVVEQAFLKANPGLSDDMITVTCRDGWIEEVRLCLSHRLEPVTCGADLQRDCRLDEAHFAPVN